MALIKGLVGGFLNKLLTILKLGKAVGLYKEKDKPRF